MQKIIFEPRDKLDRDGTEKDARKSKSTHENRMDTNRQSYPCLERQIGAQETELWNKENYDRAEGTEKALLD